jgi:diamine N-acetyltransferase
MAPMIIRRATPEDAAALAEIASSTFVDAFGAMNDPGNLAMYLAQAYGEPQQRGELADPDLVTLVAEEGGALVAYAQVRRDGANAELARFYVRRAHHGRGLAQRLMRETENAARAFGAQSLWLGVWEKNPRAIAFYAKCGFADTGSKPFIVGNDVQTDRVMVKPLRTRLRDLHRERAVWLYAALTALFFHKPLTTETFFFRDLYGFFFPKKVLLASALRSGTFPLWDPFTNGGQPYLATPTYAALHPSNVLYAVLPPVAAFNIIIVVHFFLCAAGAYWLARVIGLPRIAAFAAGAAFAFAGVTLSSANLLWVLALPWIPLTIGLAHRALREGRSIVPAAFTAAMPLFGSLPEAAVMLFVTLFVWMAAMRGVSMKRRAAALLVVVVGAIGLSLVVTLPATSVVAQSSRGGEKRSWESFTRWSVHPRRLPELIVPQYFGPTDTLDDRDYRGRRWESGGFPLVLSIYFGAPLLILAVAGAMRPAPDGIDAPRVALALLALGALLLSLGCYLPGFRFLYDSVPLVTMFRYPVKALLMVLLPVALLAALAIASVAERRSAALLAAMVAIDLLAAGARVNAYAPRSIFDEPPIASMVRRTIGPLRLYSAPRPLVVRAPENHVRWLAMSHLTTLNGVPATTFGIPVAFNTDIDQLAPRAIVQLGARLQRLSWSGKKPILDAAGVAAILTPEDIRVPGIVEVARFDTLAGPLRLYRNDGPKPARFAGPCAGAARLVSRDLNGARYESASPCAGHVVFAETHYDGWRVTVDGDAVEPVRANVAFTAVKVPAGRHAIERRYAPPRFAAGLAGALATAVLLLLLARRTAFVNMFTFSRRGAAAPPADSRR